MTHENLYAGGESTNELNLVQNRKKQWLNREIF